MKIEFVSYTGKYPYLCGGELTLKIDGEEKIFGFDIFKYPESLKKQAEMEKNHYKRFWLTGGSCSLDEDYLNTGPWKLCSDMLPEELKPYGQELINIFNENVPWGCCGGCL